MEGLKTKRRKRGRIYVICPICKKKVQKKMLKRHQQSNLCSLQKTVFEIPVIPVIPGPDFVRKELEKRRLIEHYRENRRNEKKCNDMGKVSHQGYHDGSIAITGGREKVICPFCKREVFKSVRHQKSEMCLKVRDALFKEKETICS